MPEVLQLDVQGIRLAPAEPPEPSSGNGLVVRSLSAADSQATASHPQLISQTILALQTIPDESVPANEIDAVKQLIAWLSAMPDTEVVLAPGAAEYLLTQPPYDLAKGTLETLVVQDALHEAGQRHTNEEYALIDQILDLLKRLRGQTPAEQRATQQAHADDPTQLMRDGYRGMVREGIEDQHWQEILEQHAEILREAGSEGREWDVSIIQAGVSKNGRLYPLGVLQQAAPLFEGARVYTYDRLLKGRELYDHLSEEELRANPQGYAKDLVGFLKSPRIEGSRLIATLVILEGAAWLRANLQDAFRHGQPTLYGLSIDAEGDGHRVESGGTRLLQVDAIRAVRSVDVVTYPAAGGRFLRLVASRTSALEEHSMDKELLERLARYECRFALQEALDASELPAEHKQTIRLQFNGRVFEAAELETAIATAKVAVETLAAKDKALKEAADKQVEPQPDPIDAKLQEAIDKVTRRYEEAEGRLRLRESAALLKEQLAGCELPTKAKAKLEKQFTGRIFEAQELTDALTEMRELVAELDQSGQVRLPGQARGTVRLGESEPEKLMLAFDGFFANEDLKGADGNKVRRFVSLQEAWKHIMREDWDVEDVLRESVSGRRYDSHGRAGVQAERIAESKGRSTHQRMVEALTTTSWAQILGDSITRRMLVEYQLDGLQDWRMITSEISNVKDFRTQRRMRVGGYGTLPVVDQSGPYTELTSPTDEEVTYAISKRGGLESITLEMLANDDVGSIRRIPQRLGRAAGETLYRAVFDPINNNSALTYDSDTTALFTAGHANIETLVLNAANFETGIQDLAAQTAYGNASEFLRLKPKILLHVRNLRRMAFKLTDTQSGEPETFDHDANPYLQYGIQRIQVDYWTSTTKWIIVADPRVIPTIEVGFFNGNEDPEIFVSDQENAAGGSMFDADKVSYKIRHIHGVAILEHRSMVRGNA